MIDQGRIDELHEVICGVGVLREVWLVHISVGGKAMMHFLDEPDSARAGFSKKSLWLKIFSCCVVATKYHGST